MALMEVQDIQVYYGMIQALKGVSFSVNEGEVIALIGANGAGKTTTLHTVTGLLRAKSGHIIYDGQDITKVPPHKIVTMGMAHVPEGRRVFANMTVLQNLKMGAFTRSDKNEIDATIEKVYKRFPRLKERQNQTAGTLSGGEQQMLAMGRALMSQPKIILMDEPSMGLSPLLVKEIFKIIRQVNRNGADYMVAEAQCQIRSDGMQRFRFYAAGGMGACIGWQTVELPTTPSTQAAYVTDLSPHWEGDCWSPFQVVMMPSSGCTGGNCSYHFEFGTLGGSSNWTLPLSFVQPAMVQHETDVWVDKSAVLNAGGRCTVTTADTCVDGPATKVIEGRPVTRACWSYERTLTCTAGAPVDECASLASSGCTPATSTCKWFCRWKSRTLQQMLH